MQENLTLDSMQESLHPLCKRVEKFKNFLVQIRENF